jgi:hypothetical protein
MMGNATDALMGRHCCMQSRAIYIQLKWELLIRCKLGYIPLWNRDAHLAYVLFRLKQYESQQSFESVSSDFQKIMLNKFGALKMKI